MSCFVVTALIENNMQLYSTATLIALSFEGRKLQRFYFTILMLLSIYYIVRQYISEHICSWRRKIWTRTSFRRLPGNIVTLTFSSTVVCYLLPNTSLFGVWFSGTGFIDFVTKSKAVFDAKLHKVTRISSKHIW